MNPSSSSSTGINGSDDNTSIRRNSNRPKYSRFTQQELPACKPILTPKWVISVFLLVGVVFIPIGLVSLLASRDVVEIVDRYDVECVPQNSRNDKVGYITNGNQDDKICVRSLTVPKKMNQPIYVYYQLENFYQNHRRYVKSRSDQQLKSKNKFDDTGSCDPEDKVNGKPIVPCGLIAWSLFNDTYSFSTNKGNKSLVVNKKGIAWKSDRDHKFGKRCFSVEFSEWTFNWWWESYECISERARRFDCLDENCCAPTFRKLYGKIEADLVAGEVINVTLENNYNTYSFDGKKKLVLSTTSWIGGKNDFLGIAYLTVGGLCFFLALAFMIVYLVKPRQLGDPTYLSWNRNPGGN